MRIANVQRPHIGNDVTPRGNFNLDAEVGQDARHVGNGLLQGQIFAQNEGAALGIRLEAEQGLSVFIQVGHFFDDKFRAFLHHFFNGTALNGIKDATSVYFRNVRWQLHLNFEDLLVAVFGINNVVLRKSNVLSGNVAGVAIQLHKVGSAQSRGSQKVVERAGC